MNTFTFLINQQGTASPTLKFDAVPAPDVTLARLGAGEYAFGGSAIPDTSRVRLFISPMECENQITGDPIRPSMVNQGTLKLMGRDLAGALSDFNMTPEVAIPAIIQILP